MTANFEINKTIVVHRKAAGLSQATVAKELGVSTALIGFWETGRSVPPQHRVAQLEKILGPLRKSLPGRRVVSERVDPVVPIDTKRHQLGVNNEIGRKIKERRIAAGLTQAALGKKLGLSPAAIGNWEAGKPVSEDRISALERIIGRISPGPKTGQGGEQAFESARIVGQWLSKALLRKDWTVVELAEKSGVSQATIYNLQSGRAENARPSTIEKLEKALGEPLPKEFKTEVEEENEIRGIPGVGDFLDFDPHDMSECPSEPGVYVFYDITNSVLKNRLHG